MHKLKGNSKLIYGITHFCFWAFCANRYFLYLVHEIFVFLKFYFLTFIFKFVTHQMLTLHMTLGSQLSFPFPSMLASLIKYPFYPHWAARMLKYMLRLYVSLDFLWSVILSQFVFLCCLPYRFLHMKTYIMASLVNITWWSRY